MAVANMKANAAFTDFETLVAEYKLTLACCREAIDRLEFVERRLQDAAAKLGIATDSLELSKEIGGRLQAVVPKLGKTSHLVELLSDRELLVFTLIGQGRTTQQIAEELSLATSTVETYRERLKNKLALASGAALTREAVLWTANR